jgi:hypothetical protein
MGPCYSTSSSARRDRPSAFLRICSNTEIRASGITVIGTGNVIYGDNVTIFGNGNRVCGDECAVYGNYNILRGNDHLISGSYNKYDGINITIKTGQNNHCFSGTPRRFTSSNNTGAGSFRSSLRSTCSSSNGEAVY